MITKGRRVKTPSTQQSENVTKSGQGYVKCLAKISQRWKLSMLLAAFLYLLCSSFSGTRKWQWLLDHKDLSLCLYNIFCTVNTQHTLRQDAIITIRLYVATCFGRKRPSSGQLRTILRYSKNIVTVIKIFLLYLNIVLSWPEDGRLRPKHVATYNLIVIIAYCLNVCCVLTVQNILYKFDNTQRDGLSLSHKKNIALCLYLPPSAAFSPLHYPWYLQFLFFLLLVLLHHDSSSPFILLFSASLFLFPLQSLSTNSCIFTLLLVPPHSLSSSRFRRFVFSLIYFPLKDVVWGRKLHSLGCSLAVVRRVMNLRILQKAGYMSTGSATVGF